jgi:trigger factor
METNFMQITRAELNPCTVQLTVVAAEEAVKSGFSRAFKKITKDIKLPGFRPGSAPRQMLEQHINPDHLAEVAADIIVRDTFTKALESEKLEPHSQPSISVKELNQEESKCTYEVKVPLAPQVELIEYKNLKASRPQMEVTEEEITHQIDELRRGKSTRTAVSGRGIEEGDVAVVNVRPDGDEGEGRNFMTIAGQTFPQLDQALMGMTSDEIKHLELTFPDNFQEKDWATKNMKAQVSVRSINAVQMPELDDTFAKSLRTESVEELRESVREAITIAKDNMVADYLNEQLLESLLTSSTVHVPDTMWEQVASRRLNDLAQEQHEKGVTMEQYAEQNGMKIEELVAAWEHEAKLHVQRAVIVQKIFDLESMKLVDADLNRELIVMSREYEMDAKDLLDIMKKQGSLQELHFRSVFRKVTDFLREHAQIEISDAPPAQTKPKKSKKS